MPEPARHAPRRVLASHHTPGKAQRQVRFLFFSCTFGGKNRLLVPGGFFPAGSAGLQQPAQAHEQPCVPLDAHLARHQRTHGVQPPANERQRHALLRDQRAVGRLPAILRHRHRAVRQADEGLPAAAHQAEERVLPPQPLPMGLGQPRQRPQKIIQGFVCLHNHPPLPCVLMNRIRHPRPAVKTRENT